MTQAEKVVKITEILKMRFPRIPLLDLVHLAHKILEAIEINGAYPQESIRDAMWKIEV